jgi:RNA ligase
MNHYQQTLYADLMTLCTDTEVFYFQDFQLDGKTYRIFNYRLSSYTDFMRPNALECRGHMFEVQGDVAVRLASLPQSKFFNLNENPSTMGLDLGTIISVEPKADGSLISTFIHNGTLRLKSKGSINSDQANAAMAYLDRPENQLYKMALYACAADGRTVNLEWVGPSNRIVLPYGSDHLLLLNVRDHDTGKTHYMSIDNDDDMESVLDFRKTRYSYPLNIVGSKADFVAGIPSMTNIEGFVVRLASGQCVKVKTTWYLALHHTKDSITNPRRLFEAVVDECVDDLRSLFWDDPIANCMIDEMQNRVDGIYNHLIVLVERFYEANKELSRKDYAIKGQEELPRLYFVLAMNLLLGKQNDYKSFLKAKYKEFGFVDTSVAV